MRWDASRPVPWRRLVKEWLIYAAIMTAVFAFLYRDSDSLLPIVGGLFVSGPLYLLLGYVLAKFGYTRKTLSDLRTPRATSSSSAPSDDEPAPRPRPAPTRRTSGGPSRANRPKSKRR
jgi:hypothetical protein